MKIVHLVILSFSIISSLCAYGRCLPTPLPVLPKGIVEIVNHGEFFSISMQVYDDEDVLQVTSLGRITRWTLSNGEAIYRWIHRNTVVASAVWRREGSETITTGYDPKAAVRERIGFDKFGRKITLEEHVEISRTWDAFSMAIYDCTGEEIGALSNKINDDGTVPGPGNAFFNPTSSWSGWPRYVWYVDRDDEKVSYIASNDRITTTIIKANFAFIPAHFLSRLSKPSLMVSFERNGRISGRYPLAWTIIGARILDMEGRVQESSPVP